MTKTPKPPLSHRDFMTLIRKPAKQRRAENRAVTQFEKEVYRECVRTHGRKIADGGRAIIVLANELGGGWSGTLIQLEAAIAMFKCVVTAAGEFAGYKDTPKPEAEIVTALRGQELIGSTTESTELACDPRPNYYAQGGMTKYVEGRDPEITCAHCGKTFLCDALDAACRLCGKFFSEYVLDTCSHKVVDGDGTCKFCGDTEDQILNENLEKPYR